MSRHRWLLRFFPASWRSRYGHEVAELLDEIEADEGHVSARDRFDLARAGISAHVDRMSRGLAGAGHGPLLARCGAAALLVIVGSLATVWGIGAFSSSPRPRAPTRIGAAPAPSPTTTLSSPAPAQEAAQAAAEQAALEQQAAAAAAQAAAEQQDRAAVELQATRAAARAAAQAAAVGSGTEVQPRP